MNVIQSVSAQEVVHQPLFNQILHLLLTSSLVTYIESEIKVTLVQVQGDL